MNNKLRNFLTANRAWARIERLQKDIIRAQKSVEQFEKDEGVYMLDYIPIFKNWVDFLSLYNFSHWEKEGGDFVDEINVETFLKQPDIHYERLIGEEYNYVHIFNLDNFSECLIRDVEAEPFYVVYVNGECTGEAFFNKVFAEEELEKRRQKNEEE